MPPDTQTAKNLLEEIWAEILAEEGGNIDPVIDALIESNSVSIRFCLPTQLLGKLTDSKLDILCLQKGDGSLESMWDPRGFASKIVVPWVSEN